MIRIMYSVHHHRQLFTLDAFEQFGTLYMHNPDDRHPTSSKIEPSTFEFWATTGLNKPSVSTLTWGLIVRHPYVICKNSVRTTWWVIATCAPTAIETQTNSENIVCTSYGVSTGDGEIYWISCGVRSVTRNVQALSTTLRTGYEFFFSYDRLGKAAKNAPALVGMAFVQVIVTSRKHAVMFH